jgi:ion channel-forming bestrophin family protein
MFISTKIPLYLIIKRTYKRSTLYILWVSTLSYLQHEYKVDISVSLMPMTALGVAVSLFLGFRNNAAYDRFWEARKVWGGVVNTSRSFICYLKNKNISNSTLKKLALNHIDYLYLLVVHLKGHSSTGAINDDLNYNNSLKNKPNYVLDKQYEIILELSSNDDFDGFDKKQCIEYLDLFFTYQGKCERIKNTPLPKQYTYFTLIFTYLYLIFLPFGMLDALGWGAIGFSFLVFWVFSTAEQIGSLTENPFDGSVNSVAIETISRTIEIDIKQLIGMEAPEPLKATKGALY